MDEEVKQLKEQVANLISIVEALADITKLNTDDEISSKINEILSKFNQN